MSFKKKINKDWSKELDQIFVLSTSDDKMTTLDVVTKDITNLEDY